MTDDCVLVSVCRFTGLFGFIAEKFVEDLNFGEKNGILVVTGPGPCQIEVTSLHFVL